MLKAVSDLREPYRSVIRLRFYDDIGPKAIAQQLGVPLSTVKTQLSRGLGMLRSSLDQSCNGDREEWSVCLTGILTQNAASAAFSLKSIAIAIATFLVVSIATVTMWWPNRDVESVAASSDVSAGSTDSLSRVADSDDSAEIQTRSIDEGAHRKGVLPESLSAEAILARMRRAYATCETYRDEGDVRTVFNTNGAKRVVVKPFQTAFVRPDRFRFEFRDGDNQYVIWKRSDEVLSWWTIQPQIEKRKGIADAVGAARGVSGAASTRIPSLLSSEVAWDFLLNVDESQLLGKDYVEGDPWWLLRVHSRGKYQDVWIDESKYLLRKVFERREHEGFSTEATTSYRPCINEAVSEEELGFEPPLTRMDPEEQASDHLHPPIEQSPMGSVDVRVYDPEGGRPLRDATIRVAHPGTWSVFEAGTQARTDGSGHASLERQTLGRLWVVAEHQGFAPTASELLTLTPGNRQERTSITMTLGGTLVGMLTDVND